MDEINTKVGVLISEVENLKSADVKLGETDNSQWTAINDIRNFMHKLVPVWVTVVLMALSAITGSALTFAGMIIRMSK